VLRVCLASGSTFQGAPGWGAANFLSTSGQFNGLSSTSNVFELFDVRLLIDYDGLGAGFDPGYPVTDMQRELIRAMRYWQKQTLTLSFFETSTGEAQYRMVTLKAPMRVSPTRTQLAAGTLTNVAGLTFTMTDEQSVAILLTGTGANVIVQVAQVVSAYDALLM
jgi:hypothetical protein